MATYSQGFSPHPRVSYVGAAPTGAASEAECLEIAVTSRCDRGCDGSRTRRRTAAGAGHSRRRRGAGRLAGRPGDGVGVGGPAPDHRSGGRVDGHSGVRGSVVGRGWNGRRRPGSRPSMPDVWSCDSPSSGNIQTRRVRYSLWLFGTEHRPFDPTTSSPASGEWLTSRRSSHLWRPGWRRGRSTTRPARWVIRWSPTARLPD